MLKLRLIALFIVFSAAGCLSQSIGDLSSQGLPSLGAAADCSDPLQAASPACGDSQAQRSGGSQGQGFPATSVLPPELKSSSGSITDESSFGPPPEAILERDEASNLELQPGDIVTIFSQRDVSVPQVNRSQYVIVEGEVMRPGVYKLETNETLHSVLRRAGGLTPDVYRTQLTRESARIQEQKSLDELVRTMEVQIRQTAVSVAASGRAGELPQMLAAQEAIIGQLHKARASGRVALPVQPSDKSLTDFPNMAMEDDDRVTIAQNPSTVAVVGNVYNPGSFIFDPYNSEGAYLEVAGKGKPNSDLHHAFVLRANGFVVAASDVNGIFVGSKFDRLRLYSGDQIIVHYKLPLNTFVRGLRDWTQIASQLAMIGGVLSTVLP
jgi:protein involved in polysaccharide export with SLBB domain